MMAFLLCLVYALGVNQSLDTEAFEWLYLSCITSRAGVMYGTRRQCQLRGQYLDPCTSNPRPINPKVTQT